VPHHSPTHQTGPTRVQQSPVGVPWWKSMAQPVPVHPRSLRASERHIPSSRDCNSSRSDRLSTRSEWHTRLRGASCPRSGVPLAGVAEGSVWPRPEPVLVECLESTQRNLSGMSTWTALTCGIKGSRPACAPESVQRCAICDTGCDTASGLGDRLRSVDGEWKR